MSRTEPAARAGGDHHVKAITPDAIRAEVANLSKVELIRLRFTLHDHMKLTEELISKRIEDGAVKGPTSTFEGREWRRRAEASIRIIGLQIHIIDARLAEIKEQNRIVFNTEEANEKRRQEKTLFEIAFIREAKRVLDKATYMKIAQAAGEVAKAQMAMVKPEEESEK